MSIVCLLCVYIYIYMIVYDMFRWRQKITQHSGEEQLFKRSKGEKENSTSLFLFCRSLSMHTCMFICVCIGMYVLVCMYVCVDVFFAFVCDMVDMERIGWFSHFFWLVTKRNQGRKSDTNIHICIKKNYRYS